MKKSLVALAALAVAGVASAQSSVTLFGVVDASVSGYVNKSEDLNNFLTTGNPFYVNQGSVKVSRTVLGSSGYNSSRLGFRGTEDLGGGLAASFWLEAGLNNDDGTGAATGGGLSFNRRSTVSLSGGFGEIRLGRDYVPTFWNDTVFDPFGTNGVGTNLIFSASNTNVGTVAGGVFPNNTTYIRASNSIGYFLPPNLGGFYGQLMYSFNERDKYDPGTATPTTNLSRTGRYVGGRFGYANGPLDVAVAYGAATVGDAFYAGTTDTVKTLNLGASYDFGPVKLFGEASKLKGERDYENAPAVAFTGGLLSTPRPDTDLTGFLIGATVPVGPGLIRVSYSHVKYDLNNTALSAFAVLPDDPKADKLALGYVHNLSKRTALYATVAYVKNKNGAGLSVGGPNFVSTSLFTPKNSTGYDLGIRHAF